MTTQPENSGQGKHVDIDWFIPDGTQAVYANQLVAQHTQSEFTLSFFSVEQPILLGTDEERQQKLDSLSSVRARCVSQIVVSPVRIKAFIDMLQANYDTFVGKYIQPEDE